MILPRAYLGPWGKNGIKVDAYGKGLGVLQSNNPADPTALNNAAQQALVNAGYAGATCHTEKVSMPDGTFYTQNVCSAPGYSGGDEANLVLALTPAQLAAQRAYEQANYGEGTSATPDYFQMTAGAPNIQVSNPTGAAPAVILTSKPDVKPPVLVPSPQQQTAAQVPTNTVNKTQTPITTTPTPSLFSSFPSFDFSSLMSGNNLYYLIGAGAVLYFMTTKGKR